ncbi:MAG: prepilin-type N-terminal cleavage/methylation domain-containing protein [Phycisphaerales bacterium]|nr:prepilin-type N-terminal cleavage/methylation domain-containing protein [Phycisphaerales bacterium]
MTHKANNFCSYRNRSGFSLVELMVVVVIMGIITVSVIPAMDNLRSIREGAARDDFVRMIEVVKGQAVASGKPHGLQVDISINTLTIVELDAQGRVQEEFDPLTNSNRTVNLSMLYPGVTMLSMSNGDGTPGSGTLWFDFESNPHTRDADGSFGSINTDTASIVLSSNVRIIVYPHSGVVEVQ